MRKLISNSLKMKRIYQFIECIARTDATVLLTGETGTGKELVANLVHQKSNRSNKPFVAINCGAIPSELMERELFGHERGAFTGAHQKMMGKLEYSNGGTVFLDEIATLPMHLQTKLLRVIQEKTFERIGSFLPVKVDIRFVAATNADLIEEIKKGSFREDLYYRLRVLPIEIPPLRERKEDIPLLVRYFLEEYGKKYGKRTKDISKEAVEILVNYPWPGNIRELQNLAEMLVVLAKEGAQIVAADLPDCFVAKKVNALTYEEAYRLFEREYLQKILESTDWNKNEAARKMKIHRNTLYAKIKGLNLKH